MSEENHEVSVIENKATPAEVEKVAPEKSVEVDVIEESLEVKYANLEKELEKAKAERDNTQKGLIKVKRKKQSKIDQLEAELRQNRAELDEYKGTVTQSQQAPTAQQMRLESQWAVRVEELESDESFVQLYKESASNGNNPFEENKHLPYMMAQQGVHPKLIKYILTDADLCERFEHSENPYEVHALVEIAKEREKNMASKPVQAQIKKPVNEPKIIPSLKTNNTGTKPKPQSNEDWYAEFVSKK